MTAGDVDPARAAFVRLVKSVLGDDPEIAKISEVRPSQGREARATGTEGWRRDTDAGGSGYR
jgi:hypothetical protein